MLKIALFIPSPLSMAFLPQVQKFIVYSPKLRHFFLVVIFKNKIRDIFLQFRTFSFMGNSPFSRPRLVDLHILGHQTSPSRHLCFFIFQIFQKKLSSFWTLLKYSSLVSFFLFFPFPPIYFQPNLQRSSKGRSPSSKKSWTDCFFKHRLLQ